MRESTLEKSCTAWAKDNGWLSYKFTSPNARSVPDRIFIRDNEVVFVEFKAPGKKPTKLQQHTINKMRSYGAIVWVIDNKEDFKNVMS